MTRHYCSKPIIAAVNGKAVGGGAEMLLACDLVVISNDGFISFPEVRHSLLATGGGGLLRIGRSVPIKRAMELMLTGDPIDAQTAYDWGLVNRVCEPGKAVDVAFELAKAITKNGPLAVAWTKLAIYDCMDKSFLAQTDGWRMMIEMDVRAKKTEDAHEGEAAFTEKRNPVWKGR
jgi:enoyl-CoA hydratase/carnithine racemase